MINRCFQDTIGFTALIVLLLSQVCMFFKLEPFYTWFYLFAWWSYIIFIDSILYKLNGNSLIRSRGKEILILSAWSAAFWFIFETVNFFLKNWYYINLPADDFLRISGIILAFATVLPGIFITSELLEISNAYKSISIKRFRFNNYVLWILFLTGVLFALLSITFPKIFFPLIWGSFTLTLEPILYWLGGRSLFKDLENGNPRKVLILLTSGLICGFLWEFWNYWAYSKWVYTIPYWNTGKIFEMPVAGFLGFPPFAIDCYVMYNFVCLFRKDGGWERIPHPVSYPLPKPVTTFILPLVMIAFSLIVIKNMEKYTIGSHQSSVKDIPAVSAEDYAYLVDKGLSRIHKFIKLCGNPENLKKISKDLNRPLQTVHRWCNYALLIDFQGIGAANLLVLRKAGIESILDLAKTNPAILLEKFKNNPPARVKLWINEAKKLK
ncbi:MAG: DUF4332 domain-containing protein [Nitrospinota bacterium]